MKTSSCAGDFDCVLHAPHVADSVAPIFASRLGSRPFFGTLPSVALQTRVTPLQKLEISAMFAGTITDDSTLSVL